MNPEKACVEQCIVLWNACHAIKDDLPGPNIDRQLCYTFARMDYEACLADLKARGLQKGQDVPATR